MGMGVFDHWEDGTHETKVASAIEQTCEYTNASWRFMGELDYGNDIEYGYFNSCDKK
jgi:hypothetical protein